MSFLTIALLMPSPSCCGGVSQGLCGAELPTKVNLKQLIPHFFFAVLDSLHVTELKNTNYFWLTSQDLQYTEIKV